MVVISPQELQQTAAQDAAHECTKCSISVLAQQSTIGGFIELLHFVHFEHLLETKLKKVHEVHEVQYLSAGSAKHYWGFH